MRKSRWGNSDEDNANGDCDQTTFDEQKVPVESHNIQDTSEGLESFDAPATPPDQFDGQDHEVPNDFGSNDNVVMEDVMPDYEERAPPAVPQPGLGEYGGEGVQESYEPESSLQPEPTTEESSSDPQNQSEPVTDMR